MRTRHLLGLLIAPHVAILIACSGSSTPTTAPTNHRSANVSQSDLGDEWPLTVDRGVIHLEGSIVASFETEDGRRYGLNGFGLQKYGPIDPIWKPNPEFPEMKVSITPLIDLALSLAESDPAKAQ